MEPNSAQNRQIILPLIICMEILFFDSIVKDLKIQKSNYETGGASNLLSKSSSN